MERIDLNIYKDKNMSFIHEGIVSAISGNKITVTLLGNVNCEACHAKGACGVTENTTKEVEVFHYNNRFSLNETVTVLMKKELGLKAVFWAYVLPFVLLIAVLFTASQYFEEWIAGVLSLFILVPYYFALFALKDKFRKAFAISIIKNDKS